MLESSSRNVYSETVNITPMRWYSGIQYKIWTLPSYIPLHSLPFLCSIAISLFMYFFMYFRWLLRWPRLVLTPPQPSHRSILSTGGCSCASPCIVPATLSSTLLALSLKVVYVAVEQNAVLWGGSFDFKPKLWWNPCPPQFIYLTSLNFCFYFGDKPNTYLPDLTRKRKAMPYKSSCHTVAAK